MAPVARLAAALLLAGAPAYLAEDIDQVHGLEHDVELMRHEVEALRALVDERRRLTWTGVDPAVFATQSAHLEEVQTNATTAIATAMTDSEGGNTELMVAMDSLWLLLCGALVMFMHVGFAMLETGSCRAKNASNVLMKNLANVCVGTLAWFFFGWGVAYGGPYDDDGMLNNGIMGTQEFAAGGFLTEDDLRNQVPYEADAPATSKMLGWFFQWAFCTAAATIVSGGVAERVKTPAYACYAFVMAAFIYPCVVAWTWGYGWLATAGNIGYMDFAGSGIVHLTGGASALAGTIVLGPRKGRWDEPENFEPHNLPLVVLGTLSLWFGWYGFNCGSTLGMSDATTGAMGAQVAMNTTLSAATGGLTVFILRYGITKRYDVAGLCNGILAGLVSITAPCGNVESGSAIVIGLVGGIVYQLSSMFQQFIGIDDPVDASSVHGACGIWGVLAAGLFDWGNGFDHVHGWSGFHCMTDSDGECLDTSGGWFMVAQMWLILAVCVWSSLTSGVTFTLLKMTGKLRVDEDVEDKGMDAVHHSPSKAYAMTIYRQDLNEQNYGQQ